MESNHTQQDHKNAQAHSAFWNLNNKLWLSCFLDQPGLDNLDSHKFISTVGALCRGASVQPIPSVLSDWQTDSASTSMNDKYNYEKTNGYAK